MAQSALSAATAEPPLPGEEPEGPIPLWIRGPEGAFTTLAFGGVPVLLPIIAMIMVYDSISRDRASGYFETLLSRPVPRWAHGMGKYVGLVAATLLPALILVFGAAVLMQATLAAEVPPTLLWGVMGTVTFLILLYMGLGLALSTILSQGAAGSLLILFWIAFHAISPAGVANHAEFLQIIPLREQVYRADFLDLLSFTGLYQGLTSLFVPANLEFVIVPGVADWVGRVAYFAVIYANVPWIFAVLVIFIVLYYRLKVA